MSRHLFIAQTTVFVLLLSTQSFSQDGIKPYDKKAEKEKFHSTATRGSTAEQKAAAYQKRLKLESDSFFGNLLWRNVGPENQSGRVLSIQSPSASPNDIYVGFATGGLYRTNDEGQSWTSLFENQSAFGIGDFKVTKDGKTIYLGTGEANNQRTSYAGTGMFKSTDSGKSWTNIGLPESHHIARVTIDPRNESTVWVSVMGHLYSANPERGLYKTIDGGKTWQHVLKKDDLTGCVDFQLHPKNSQIGIAAMYHRERKAWNFLEAGPGSEVMRTDDGGKSWKGVAGLPKGDSLGRVGLAWAQNDEKIVYALVENPGKNEEWLDEDERVPGGRLTPRRFAALSEEQFTSLDSEILKSFWSANAPRDAKLDEILKSVKDGKMKMSEVRKKLEERNPNLFEPGQKEDEVYKSVDGGKSFARVAKLGQQGGYYWGKIYVNPRDDNDVWLCELPALRSKDGGKTWKVGVDFSVHVDYHAVFFDHRNPNWIWVGNDGGPYLSKNDGKSWTHLNNLSVAQSTTIAVDNATPYNVYTGLQDNGTMKGPSTYIPGVTALDKWIDIGGGDGSAIAVDTREDVDIVYIASQFGAHQARDQKTGRVYSARPREAGTRANWVSPIILSSFHQDIVYVGFNKLFRSFDRGKSYKAISPDLTKNKIQGDVPHSTLKDISESPIRFGLIYCGADDGRMTMTPDGGFTWNDIPTPQPDKWISRVVASRYNENTVYVAQNGYRDDDWKAYLWKSTDQGKTWTSIVANLPDEPINVVREDSKNKDILYVGTDMGVYVTFDGGKSWESLHGGLGHLPVHDMVIQEREYELVIGTHARGAFILPLKQLEAVTKELRNTELDITSLGSLSFSTGWGYERREKYSKEMPKPPALKVNFFTNVGGSATVELVNKEGKVIVSKQVSSLKGFNATDLEMRLTAESFDQTKPERSKDGLADPFQKNRPTFVPKGEYKVRVTIGSKVVTKDWKLD
jgi:photosystem II stability/assembly factor-like uncharacterized protein